MLHQSGNNNFSADAIEKLWYLCDLKVYNVDGLDCANYCGTVDEECNNTFINASCSDVGCGGSGKPQCTNLCRLNYTKCLAGGNEISFQLDLKTDDKGWETSWTIDNDFNEILQSGPYRNNASITEYYCMEKRSCYTFELSDIGGDGICCGANDVLGSYTVTIDASITPDVNFSFGSEISYEFGTCNEKFSNHPSNKPSQSINPSNMPTPSPSSKSSIVPSLSINPSRQPITPVTLM